MSEEPLLPEYCRDSAAHEHDELEAIIGEASDSQRRRVLLAKLKDHDASDATWELESRFSATDLEAWFQESKELEIITKNIDLGLDESSSDESLTGEDGDRQSSSSESDYAVEIPDSQSDEDTESVTWIRQDSLANNLNIHPGVEQPLNEVETSATQSSLNRLHYYTLPKTSSAAPEISQQIVESYGNIHAVARNLRSRFPPTALSGLKSRIPTPGYNDDLSSMGIARYDEDPAAVTTARRLLRLRSRHDHNPSGEFSKDAIVAYLHPAQTDTTALYDRTFTREEIDNVVASSTWTLLPRHRAADSARDA